MLFGRLAFEAEQLADFDLHGEVASRPDVGAPFGKQQIDFR
jgi:hypothetical protein